MAEAFIVRRGGSSGNVFAFIKVTYPEGSVCTCSNGSKTLTAKDTSGEFIFSIPVAGTWTVSCTNGDKTTQKVVTINNQGESHSVMLAYEYVLYDNGARLVEWDSSSKFKETYIEMAGASGAAAAVSTSATSLLHIEGFTNLCIDYMNTGASGSRAIRHTGVYDANGTTEIAVADPEGVVNNQRLVLQIPVDNVTGDYRVIIKSNTSTSSKFNVYKVWFE